MENIGRIRSELRSLVRELGLLDRNCWNSDLSLLQAHILTCLYHGRETSFSGLCAQLHVEKASLSRSLNTLAAKNYVGLHQDDVDRRKKFVVLLPGGAAALEHANRAADAEVGGILDGLDGEEVEAVWRGLRLLRTKALRRNWDSGRTDVRLERLDSARFDEVMALEVATFSGEQGIPVELIPLDDAFPAYWWCALVDEHVVGAAACWQEEGHWHWGRFVVDGPFRGMGIGKRLARYSLEDVFDSVADAVVSEARDATVGILREFGAKTMAPAKGFYGIPVTPLSLTGANFREKTLK